MLKSITIIPTFLLVLHSFMLSAQDTLTVVMVDQEIENESQVTIPFQVVNFDTIGYFQFSIHWDTTVFEFNAVGNFNLNGLQEGAFNLSEASKAAGKIGMSWSDPSALSTTVDDSTRIFDLVLNILTTDSLTSNIIFANDPTAREAGDVNNVEVPLKTLDAEVRFAEDMTTSTNRFDNTSYRVFQNEPNPFLDQTRIPFELSRGSEVSFQVFDVTGRSIVSQKSFFPRGINYIELKKLQLNGPGIYEYALTINKKTITKKLILMDR